MNDRAFGGRGFSRDINCANFSGLQPLKPHRPGLFPRRLALVALLPLLFLVLAAPARAGARAECRSVPSKILGHPVPYCILLPPSYDTQKTRRFPVLYFLHGLGGNDQMLIDSGAMNVIDSMWEDGKLGQFLIVTPDAYTSFYINSFNGRDRYQSFFLHEFMPFIERNYRTLPGRQYRGISGISMGGYGALHLAFSYPWLFGSVTASSAALVAHLPRITSAGVRSLPFFRALNGVFGDPFNRAFWDRNDPLHLARTANLSGLKIEFDCGEQDSYGFEYGAIELNKILDARHIPHVFHLYPGTHDWEYFAARIPAALQFQSRAFGLHPRPHPATR
jgi:S-formylglutathione hydrolase FrmB